MLNRLIDRLEETLIAGFMALATLIIFFAIAHRYTSSVGWIWQYTRHIDVTWAQEACIYLFIWMAKFGAAYGVRTGIHVGVDVLVRQLDASKQRFFVVFSLLSGAFFTAVMAVLGGRFVLQIHDLGRYHPTWLCRCGSFIWQFRSAPA